MTNSADFRIAVFPGNGIGDEITEPTLRLIARAAERVGGMGYAPSADIGDEHAAFQPCHGSAPDITGKGLANPTAMILSAATMLEWLGREKGVTEAVRAGALIRHAVGAAVAPGRADA